MSLTVLRSGAFFNTERDNKRDARRNDWHLERVVGELALGILHECRGLPRTGRGRPGV
jgi:hypothetical protein